MRKAQEGMAVLNCTELFTTAVPSEWHSVGLTLAVST